MASDPALLQLQLRRNAEEMQEYMKGLENWEEEIKQRDTMLKKQKPILKKNIPPVRGRPVNKKSQTQKSERSKENEQKPERIKSHDYNAWNKYDVNAACESSSSSSSEEEEEEEEQRAEEERRTKLAELEKERGNQLFKEGKYEAAVERYTRAIELNPTSQILPANRAMALIKLQRYAAAESDCNISIALDESYLKAWLRRANVRTKLGKLYEAIEDYKQILKIDSSNKLALTELKKLEQQIQVSGREITSDSNRVYPVNRPLHLRSKKPLIRIDIEELGEVTSNISEPCLQNNGSQENEQTAMMTIPISSEEQKNNEEIGVIPTTSNSSENSIDTMIPSVPTKSEQAGIRGVDVVPCIPTSSIQFQSNWRSLQGNDTSLVTYFKAIPSSKYPLLLNQSLETNIFSDIITILKDHYIDYDVSCFEELRCMTSVPRFSVAVLFLNRKDKENLSYIFHKLMNIHEGDAIINLAQQYLINIK